MMKKVFTAPGIVPCDLLRSMLEAEGIPCMILNEYGTHLLGYGCPVPGGSALIWAWPEVWVPEEDAERARPVLEAFRVLYERDRRGPDSARDEVRDEPES